ncbi:hypothetical protein [Brevundimonas sp. NIBR10]|uniref:hypothetical protein n=1 Tax=Brevundimonas sp. NIBR10 TaxID=3015997 RepID=UPI0022F15BEC|nr:hypothetical protein [Brevundimonas sp. NIBR10]
MRTLVSQRLHGGFAKIDRIDPTAGDPEYREASLPQALKVTRFTPCGKGSFCDAANGVQL